MGDYLLKGYKMLATSCGICGTIELEDKQKRRYCVACSEVDCHENSKDNPVLSEAAASAKLAEGRMIRDLESQIEDAQGRPVVEEVVQAARAKVSNADPTTVMHHMRSNLNSSADLSTSGSIMSASLDVVLDKMVNATQTLAQTDDLETSVHLVSLIKNCADCVASLRSASGTS